MTNNPQGVIVTITGKDGYVWAHAADFNMTAPGGYSLTDGQRCRAQDAVAFAFIRNIAHAMVADALRPCDARRVLRMCMEKHGLKETVIVIGHDKEPTE